MTPSDRVLSYGMGTLGVTRLSGMREHPLLAIGRRHCGGSPNGRHRFTQQQRWLHE